MVEAYRDPVKKVGAHKAALPSFSFLFHHTGRRWAWRNARRSRPSRNQSEKRSM
jgi:hypothetical protein